ncbi:MAG TPA: cytochrome c maturation protein CcmE [Gemmatimonadaceae bacterium]|jgi:cytochrome c-type biogenesis protein CcmE|nr:cytochrome c maturation protein CcmE [Gemmatimonadaceae bacterium]HXV16558.1 cytochrome c maturation protein CcmE [Gemmatimonadaceae bacterium]
MKKSWIIGGGVIIVAVFAWLLFGGLEKNVVFFLTPKELLAKGPDGVGVPVRLGGQVKPGSMQWDAKTLDLRFTVTDGVKDIAVRSTGSPPQMFREGMGVVVEGRVVPGGLFQATNLMVKHSNEYRAPKPGEEAHEKYKTLITQSSK